MHSSELIHWSGKNIVAHYLITSGRTVFHGDEYENMSTVPIIEEDHPPIIQEQFEEVKHRVGFDDAQISRNSEESRMFG